MRKRFRGAPLVVVVAACGLASCQTAARISGAPAPEGEQVISESLKQLYMAASAAPRQSPEQRKVVQQMAEKAANGKELLLVMRASMGVFPSGDGSQTDPGLRHILATVTGKMLASATLDQLLDFASQYVVDPESARQFVERMFFLANERSDPRTWYRIKLTALRLKVHDLELQAQARGDQLVGK